jgi:hypothetical protein
VLIWWLFCDNVAPVIGGALRRVYAQAVFWHHYACLIVWFNKVSTDKRIG